MTFVDFGRRSGGANCAPVYGGGVRSSVAKRPRPGWNGNRSMKRMQASDGRSDGGVGRGGVHRCTPAECVLSYRYRVLVIADDGVSE